MLGINYESSDDEDAAQISVPELLKPPTTVAPGPTAPPTAVQETPESPESINGPAQDPRATPPPAEDPSVDNAPPGSPFTSTRLAIQNLTLPTVPNWDIPRSPPGSPPQQATKKFAQFLDLKKKGTHFNQRLQNSSVLRDPSHLTRLMDFAGISQEDQYGSTLPEDLRVPAKFPEWAYGDELNKSQKKIAETQAMLPRAKVDFVPARSTTSSNTATTNAKGARQSAAERVIGGLDKQQPTGASLQSTGKRKELEHRGGKDSRKSRWDDTSRSPKRRRSRSRDRR